MLVRRGALWWTTVVLALACAPTAATIDDGGATPPPDPRDAAEPPTARDARPHEAPEPPPPPPYRPRPAYVGGTLAVVRGTGLAVVSEPDFDRVSIVDVPSFSPLGAISLPARSEAGVVIADGRGRAHVVLRRAGAVVTIDPVAMRIVETRAVCSAPRGIAWREDDDTLHVACAEGLLVSLPAAGGAAIRTLPVEDDLRDVVVAGDRLLVSRFRAAEVIAVDRGGAIVARWTPATVWRRASISGDLHPYAPAVAWRMVPIEGGAMLVHQRERSDQLATAVTAAVVYYGTSLFSCDTVVETTVSRVDASAPSGPLDPHLAIALSLPVDISVSPDGSRLAIANAAVSASLDPLPARVVPIAMLEAEPPGPDESFPCFGAVLGDALQAGGPTTGVGFSDDGTVLLHTVEPRPVMRRAPFGHVEPLRLPLSTTDVVGDRGRMIFHSAARAGIACASCHPEGGDDGHVWRLPEQPVVRTQTIRGGVLQTAPFHWRGEIADFGELLDEVMVRRMGGRSLLPEEQTILREYLDHLDAPPRPAGDADAIARGRALFESPEVGCATCHSGEHYTSGLTVDVGTGAPLQVPTLVGIAYRAPYMHDGCAPTLRARLDDAACSGGERHGHTAHLDDAERDDLVAYLRTL